MAKISTLKKPLRVVQISDSHLFSSVEGRLLGMDTERSFNSVMDLVQQEQTHIDLVLATGDISQDTSEISYRRFADKVSHLNAPIYWLPGNHDELEMMGQVIQNPSHISPTCVMHQDWSFILLNSSVPKKVPGELADSELKFLRQALENTRKQHVVVTLHHHPVPLHSEWLDTVGLKNPQSFWDILKEFSHVKAVVWGHVHQEYDQMHHGVRCFALPSTCVQFKPLSKEFAVDSLAPGYRWFDFYPDGRIETHISRVTGQSFPVDLDGTGY